MHGYNSMACADGHITLWLSIVATVDLFTVVDCTPGYEYCTAYGPGTHSVNEGWWLPFVCILASYQWLHLGSCMYSPTSISMPSYLNISPSHDCTKPTCMGAMNPCSRRGRCTLSQICHSPRLGYVRGSGLRTSMIYDLRAKCQWRGREMGAPGERESGCWLYARGY